MSWIAQMTYSRLLGLCPMYHRWLAAERSFGRPECVTGSRQRSDLVGLSGTGGREVGTLISQSDRGSREGEGTDRDGSGFGGLRRQRGHHGIPTSLSSMRGSPTREGSP